MEDFYLFGNVIADLLAYIQGRIIIKIRFVAVGTVLLMQHDEKCAPNTFVYEDVIILILLLHMVKGLQDLRFCKFWLDILTWCLRI